MGILKGRWRCLDASGGRLLYDSEKVCQIILACCVLYNICLSHGIELEEDEMRIDQDDPPPIPAGWITHITALRRQYLIHQLYQQVNNVHIFFRMFYLGTFVQRTLNSGKSSATTSPTDSFESLCVCASWPGYVRVSVRACVSCHRPNPLKSSGFVC